MLKDPAMKLDIKAEKSAPNQFGIYHDTYWPTGAIRRRTHCYYLCDPDGNACVINPPVGKKWDDTIPDMVDEIQALERASRNKGQRELPANVVDLVFKAKSLVQERNKLDNEERETKKGVYLLVLTVVRSLITLQ